MCAHFSEVIVFIPAEFCAELRRAAPIGGVHELDVLHVFAAGAVGNGSYGFGDVVMRSESELVEGGEEMVVAGFIAGAPVAHRPGIDDLVVENVVVVGAANAGFRRVVLAGIAGRAHQLRSSAVDAEIVGGGEVDEVLGVNRAVEVIVQVSALGHVVQKREQ